MSEEPTPVTDIPTPSQFYSIPKNDTPYQSVGHYSNRGHNENYSSKTYVISEHTPKVTVVIH